MRVRVNGEEHELPAGSTVASLLEAHGLRRDGVAVALNGAVVPRSRHADTPLSDGDRVEVLTAVGGG